MKKLKFVPLAGLFFLMFGCSEKSLTDNPSQLSATSQENSRGSITPATNLLQVPIVTNELPPTARVGQNMNVSVAVQLYHTCIGVERVTVERVGLTRTYRVKAWQQDSDEWACPIVDPVIVDTTFNFTPTTKGLYTFHFYTDEVNYVVGTMTAQ